MSHIPLLRSFSSLTSGTSWVKTGGASCRKQVVHSHPITDIFLSTLRKAQVLALAIEQRGYTGEVTRQHFYLPQLHRRDAMTLLLVGLFLGGLILRQELAGYVFWPGW